MAKKNFISHNLRRLFTRLTRLFNNAYLDEIARRAFVNNAFDGALTLLGILMGTLVLGDLQPKTIISTGLGACIAMGVSGSCGRYFSERAERKQALHQIESQIFSDLSGSMMDRESRKKVIFISLIDGLSPALAAIIPLIPFFLVRAAILPVYSGVMISFVLDFLVLFILGIFLGKLSNENVLFHGVLVVLLGFITSIIIFFSSNFLIHI